VVIFRVEGFIGAVGRFTDDVIAAKHKYQPGIKDSQTDDTNRREAPAPLMPAGKSDEANDSDYHRREYGKAPGDRLPAKTPLNIEGEEIPDHDGDEEDQADYDYNRTEEGQL